MQINKVCHFWNEQSKKLLLWSKRPKKIFKKRKFGYSWFLDGKINIYDNCILKNLNKKTKNKVGIIYFNENNIIKKFTYLDIHKKVLDMEFFLNKNFPNIAKKKVMIKSSTNIDTIFFILTCVKIGAEYSVIFNDILYEGILKRISLFKPNIFISEHNDPNLKKKLKKKKVEFINFNNIKKLNNKNQYNKNIKYFDSNKNLFTLFTSGSTGTPKGIVHSTAGFFLYTKFTAIKQFGLNYNSIMLTASDIGWLNGHNYSLFAPLSLGATTVVVKNPLSLLDKNSLRKILSCGVTILYLPVTLIRMMKSVYKDKFIFRNHTLKTLGSMGEHIAPTVAKWFAKIFTKENNCIVNAYYQTENGGIICSPTFKDNTKKYPHGSAGNVISRYVRINKLNKQKKELKIISPWPGCMKNVLTNSKKDWEKYWDENNYFRMFDMATKNNNSIFIHGRNDDVINLRGKRIGCEEIESVLLEFKQISEVSAIGVPDELEGNKLYLFIVKNKTINETNIVNKIISNFGKFAYPKKIFVLKKLPKTKSGKILRRLLREMIINPNGKNYGDLTTISDKNIIEDIKLKLND